MNKLPKRLTNWVVLHNQIAECAKLVVVWFSQNTAVRECQSFEYTSNARNSEVVVEVEQSFLCRIECMMQGCACMNLFGVTRRLVLVVLKYTTGHE